MRLSPARVLRVAVALAVTVAVVAPVHAMSPHTEYVQPAHATQGDRPAASGFTRTALSGAPGVLNALADENNTLAYVRISQARNATYYNEALSRCAAYRGKARDTCVEAARVKYGKYGQAQASPPL